MTQANLWIEKVQTSIDGNATGKEIVQIVQQAWDEAVTVKRSWDTYTMTFADGSAMISGMVDFLPKKTKSIKKPRVKVAKFIVTYKGLDWQGEPSQATKAEMWEANMSAWEVQQTILQDICDANLWLDEIDLTENVSVAVEKAVRQ